MTTIATAIVIDSATTLTEINKTTMTTLKEVLAKGIVGVLQCETQTPTMTTTETTLMLVEEAQKQRETVTPTLTVQTPCKKTIMTVLVAEKTMVEEPLEEEQEVDLVQEIETTFPVAPVVAFPVAAQAAIVFPVVGPVAKVKTLQTLARITLAAQSLQATVQATALSRPSLTK